MVLRGRFLVVHAERYSKPNSQSDNEHMNSLVFVFAPMIIAIILLLASLKIAAEGERFAIFTLGRFHSFAGPGLVLILPFVQRVLKLTVGDVGQLSSHEFATFDSINIPVTGVESLRVGQAVRVDGFDKTQPRFAATSDSPKDQCPKCGHVY